MEFNTNKVQEGTCEEIIKNLKLNTYSDNSSIEKIYKLSKKMLEHKTN